MQSKYTFTCWSSEAHLRTLIELHYTHGLLVSIESHNPNRSAGESFHSKAMVHRLVQLLLTGHGMWNLSIIFAKPCESEVSARCTPSIPSTENLFQMFPVRVATVRNASWKYQKQNLRFRRKSIPIQKYMRQPNHFMLQNFCQIQKLQKDEKKNREQHN